MKLFITTLTMIFISFGVVAKEKIYECLNAGWNFKVVDPLFGKKKLFVRIKGQWDPFCNESNDIISDDGFQCHFVGVDTKYFVFDEAFSYVEFFLKDGRSQKYNCFSKK